MAATTSQAAPALRVARGLLRLSKVRVFQHYFGLALAWLMLSPAALDRPGATAAMLWLLLGSVAIVACACAADDITGYRNGSDAMNYQAGETLRDIRSKPLLSGAVTERQALVFALASGAVAVLAGAAGFAALGWRSPLAAYVLYLAGFAFSVQYSAGLRISFHRGGSETILCLATAAGLLAPYLAVEERWTLAATLAALLLGLWLVLVSSCSNINDAEGDRAVGRRTLATTVGHPVLKAAMVGYFAVEVALVLALAFRADGWPVWTLVAMLPVVATHAAQLRAAVLGGRWLEARRLALIAYNLGFLALAVPAWFVYH